MCCVLSFKVIPFTIVDWMSEYENVVAEKLRLKGKLLDVKASGITKKKKQRKHFKQFSTEINSSDIMKINTENNADGGNQMEARYDERLTLAERRYLEQWKQLEIRRLLNRANESHRDRVQRFNEYLANLSEHYDMPKVGPG
ncbi:uncharacterized protein [Spinacia oleracea]|uniref:Uncharacterized protein n=1 Tax=Spinacia oleracea TaxID=3562 RepID=A0ABM3RQF9_SPIOL|nr:uncharacterized protein LOC110799854 [Spinacia oleracea]